MEDIIKLLTDAKAGEATAAIALVMLLIQGWKSPEAQRLPRWLRWPDNLALQVIVALGLTFAAATGSLLLGGTALVPALKGALTLVIGSQGLYLLGKTLGKKVGLPAPSLSRPISLILPGPRLKQERVNEDPGSKQP